MESGRSPYIVLQSSLAHPTEVAVRRLAQHMSRGLDLFELYLCVIRTQCGQGWQGIWRQVSTGALDQYFYRVFVWLPPRDSNPDKQIQNLLSYR